MKSNTKNAAMVVCGMLVGLLAIICASLLATWAIVFVFLVLPVKAYLWAFGGDEGLVWLVGICIVANLFAFLEFRRFMKDEIRFPWDYE